MSVFKMTVLYEKENNIRFGFGFGFFVMDSTYWTVTAKFGETVQQTNTGGWSEIENIRECREWKVV